MKLRVDFKTAAELVEAVAELVRVQAYVAVRKNSHELHRGRFGFGTGSMVRPARNGLKRPFVKRPAARAADGSASIAAAFPARRNGTAILMAVVAIVIALGIGGAMVKTVVLRQEQLRRRQLAHQAQCLAESAIERALARLRRDPDYRREAWRVTFADGAAGTGVATISVEPRQGGKVLAVTAVADIPEDPLLRVRVRAEREFIPMTSK